VERLKLNVSKRPTDDLLGVQNALFGSMRGHGYQLEDLLDVWAGEMPERVREIAPLSYRQAARGDEATVVAQSVQDWIEAGVRPGEIVVLARTNRELIELERSLSNKLEVQVRREASGKLFEAPEVVATYHMLRLLLEETSDAVLYEALQTPFLRHLDPGDVMAAMLSEGPTGASLVGWFTATPEYEIVARLRDRAREDSVPQILSRLYEEFGLVEEYERAEMHRPAANLERLREYARGIARNEQSLTLRAFVENFRLAIALGYEEDEAEIGDAEADEPPWVRLLTVHGAKGLEFPYVVIPGMGRRLDSRALDPNLVIDASEADRPPMLDIDLPLRDGSSTKSPRYADRMKATREDRVEELMRLLYVAVTRAQQAVVLIGGEGDPEASRGVAWRDEVLGARAALEAAGAVIDSET
jgi:ATP-dependent helicase/nuclease subunit A